MTDGLVKFLQIRHTRKSKERFGGWIIETLSDSSGKPEGVTAVVAAVAGVMFGSVAGVHRFLQNPKKG